jgi:Alpha/beta hydrolase
VGSGPEQARLEHALDNRAADVAARLERGPNADDEAFLRQHGFDLGDPALLAAVPPMPPKGSDPVAMRKWWAGLSPAQRAAIMAAHPEWLGNTDGLPAEARDEANRIMLRENYEKVQAKLARGTEKEDLTDAEKNILKVWEMIKKREQHLDPYTGKPVPVQLYIYQPYKFDGDGRVAIAVGNLDEADHVAVNVRGGTNSQNFADPRTLRMYDESRWASGDSVAVLDWMGYDAPNSGTPDSTVTDRADALSTAKAYAGADQLTADVEGLRASRSEDPAHLTVVGHSYGATVAAIAAEDHSAAEGTPVATGQPGLDADDLVLIGSPGVPFGRRRTPHDWTRPHVGG